MIEMIMKYNHLQIMYNKQAASMFCSVLIVILILDSDLFVVLLYVKSMWAHNLNLKWSLLQLCP